VAEDLGERTELPTGRRLADARSRGQVAKSADLSAATEFIAAVVLLLIFGGGIIGGLSAILERALTPGSGLALTIDDALPLVLASGVRAAWALAAPMLLFFAVACLAQFVQVGWLLTLNPVKPKLDRLNPVAGVGRLFSRRNAVKTLVNSAKIAAIGAVGWLVIHRDLRAIAGLPLLTPAGAMGVVGRLALELLAWMLLLMLVIGIMDYAYQRWQHTQDLRMTKHEVKDERRTIEGDPEVKGRRLRMAREIALQRIRHAVPTADVVVTNPTHVAVALKYDAGTMRAPRVVAKGADLLAFRVREVAALHGVPIVERPPLARALYAGVEVGREIPPQHYQAVAEVLAYVYRLEGRAA